jgi:hypothetical protein
MRSLLGFLLFFAASITAHAAIVFDTGNELFSACSSPEQRAYCLGTTTGYSDMLQAMGETCLDKSVTRGQAADIVMRFLRDHPEARHKTAASLARAALRDAFPCRKN